MVKQKAGLFLAKFQLILGDEYPNELDNLNGKEP
jgi:hypothetical protein